MTGTPGSHQDPASGGGAPLAAMLAGMPPIACFANDWSGDPTSKHHIMRTLSAAADVLWVESSGMRRPKVSQAGDLRRIVAKLRRAAGGLRAVAPRMVVASPPGIPIPGNRLVARLNAALYQATVRRGLRRLGRKEPPLVWVYAPTVARYLHRLPGAGLVYHCVDRWWAFTEYDADEMRACHEILCRKADVVFASAHSLLEDCRPFTDRAHLIPHGVDWSHFSRAALEELPRPAELPPPGRPVIGFFGLIQDWIDQDLIVRTARAHPEATVIVIGKEMVDTSRLRAMPNVTLVGQRPFAELPAWCRAFDVALVPFAVNELTLAVNPIKLWEYLSAGVPVVATALPEVLALEGVEGLTAAATPDAFVAGVGRILAQPRTPAERRDAALAMRRHSWEGRCRTMVDLIHERLPWRT